MIEITDKYIKNGQLDKEALAEFGADVVAFEGDRIVFKTDIVFYECNSLASVSGAVFNSDVLFETCKHLISVDGATFNGIVAFWRCDSLASVSGATFKKGLKADNCPNLKQEELE